MVVSVDSQPDLLDRTVFLVPAPGDGTISRDPSRCGVYGGLTTTAR